MPRKQLLMTGCLIVFFVAVCVCMYIYIHKVGTDACPVISSIQGIWIQENLRLTLQIVMATTTKSPVILPSMANWIRFGYLHCWTHVCSKDLRLPRVVLRVVFLLYRKAVLRFRHQPEESWKDGVWFCPHDSDIEIRRNMNLSKCFSRLKKWCLYRHSPFSFRIPPGCHESEPEV